MSNIPSADQMKSDVQNILEQLNTVVYLNNKNAQILKELVPNPRVYSADFALCVNGALERYFNGLGKKLSALYSGGTPASLEIEEKHYTANPRSNYSYRPSRDEYAVSYELSEAIDAADEMEPEDRNHLIVKLIEAIRFEAIYQDIVEQCENLKEAGKSILADKLISFFSLKHKSCHPAVKRDRIIIERYSADYSSARCGYVSDLQYLLDLLRYVSLETGMDFGSGAWELKNAVMHLTYSNSCIPSRTIFGKGQQLEIACFNSKYEFRFSRSGFDALAAYVTLHGSERSVGYIADVLDSIATKAA